MFTQQQRPSLASAYTLTPSRHHLLHKPPLRPSNSNAPNATADTATAQQQSYASHTRDTATARPTTRTTRQPTQDVDTAPAPRTSSRKAPYHAAAPLLSYAYGAPTLPRPGTASQSSSPSRSSAAPLNTTVNIATAFAQAAATGNVSPLRDPFGATTGTTARKRGGRNNNNNDSDSEEEGAARSRASGPTTRRGARTRNNIDNNDDEESALATNDVANILDSDDEEEFYTPAAIAARNSKKAPGTTATVSGRLWNSVVSRSPRWLRGRPYSEVDEEEEGEHEKENQDTRQGNRRVPLGGHDAQKPRRESDEYSEYQGNGYERREAHELGSMSSRYFLRDRTPGGTLKLEYSLSDDSPPSTALDALDRDGWDRYNEPDEDVEIVGTDDEGNPYEEEERMYQEMSDDHNDDGDGDDDDDNGIHNQVEEQERLARQRRGLTPSLFERFGIGVKSVPLAPARRTVLSEVHRPAPATASLRATGAPTVAHLASGPRSYSSDPSDPTGDSYSGDYTDTEDMSDSGSASFDSAGRPHGRVRRVVRRQVPVWQPLQRLLSRMVSSSGSGFGWVLSKFLFALFICIWVAKEIAMWIVNGLTHATAECARAVKRYVVDPAGVVGQTAHMGWGRLGSFLVEATGLALLWFVEMVTMTVVTGRKLVPLTWVWFRGALRRLIKESATWGPVGLMALSVIIVIGMGVRYVNVGEVSSGPRPLEPLPTAEVPIWWKSIFRLIPSVVGWRSKPLTTYVPPSVPPESVEDIVARLMKTEKILQTTTSDVHEQVGLIAKLERRIDAISEAQGKDVEAVRTNVDTLRHDLDTLKRHVDTVMHPDALAKAMHSTVEGMLPDFMVMPMNSKTGKIEFHPEFWKYLKSLFVSKDEVAAEVKGQVDVVKGQVDVVKGQVDAVKRQVAETAEHERKERQAIVSVVELERKERVEEGKKFASKAQLDTERAGRTFAGKEMVEALWKELKTFVKKEEVEATVEGLRNERQKVEKNFVNKEQVDTMIKDKVDAVKTIVTSQPKVTPPAWKDFIRDNQASMDEFVQQHVERRVSEISKANSGVVVSKHQVMDMLLGEMSRLKQEVLETVTNKQRKYINIDMTEDLTIAIQQLIDSALQKYSEDVLAMPDYALLTSGARVIPTLTSKNYEVYPRSIRGFLASKITGRGITRGAPPQVALHPDNNVGLCWAFHGSVGELGIQLSRSVIVTDITIEHVSRKIALDLRSAPQEIEVWGVDWREISVFSAGSDDGEPVQDRTPFLIGSFRYDLEEEDPIQTFPVSQRHLRSDRAVQAVVVKVKSNWGHPDFTCLYRVRVHGRSVEA